MRDLSVIVPARNEQFLAKTIETILEKREADTEIIAILDGYKPDIPPHPDVQLLYEPESIGQRAATNLGARVSQAKYVMKLDAHCSLDQGFDRKLIQDYQDDMTLIPSMWNLHVYDWQCPHCGVRTYQGTKPRVCGECKQEGDHQMVMVWKPREGRLTISWRFDHNMQFQYWKRHHKQDQWKRKPLVETMSFIGACWFISRERYWELEGLDEQHGSWGQCGTEVACKSWLSGGRLITTRNTWFAHLFRTGNFAREGESTWPYPISQGQIDYARAYSRDFWMNNRWKKQVKPLSWLVEKFKPAPGWHDPDGAENLKKINDTGEAFYGI